MLIIHFLHPFQNQLLILLNAGFLLQEIAGPGGDEPSQSDHHRVETLSDPIEKEESFSTFIRPLAFELVPTIGIDKVERQYQE